MCRTVGGKDAVSGDGEATSPPHGAGAFPLGDLELGDPAIGFAREAASTPVVRLYCIKFTCNDKAPRRGGGRAGRPMSLWSIDCCDVSEATWSLTVNGGIVPLLVGRNPYSDVRVLDDRAAGIVEIDRLICHIGLVGSESMETLTGTGGDVRSLVLRADRAVSAMSRMVTEKAQLSGKSLIIA